MPALALGREHPGSVPATTPSAEAPLALSAAKAAAELLGQDPQGGEFGRLARVVGIPVSSIPRSRNWGGVRLSGGSGGGSPPKNENLLGSNL